MFGKIFKFALFALIGLLIYWPFRSTTRFVEALNSKDYDGINAMADWDAVNESMKDVTRQALDKVVEMTAGKNNLAAFKASSEYEQAVQVATAQTPKIGASYLASQVGRQEDGRKEKVEIESRTWSFPRDFKVRFKGDDTIFRFRLTGGSWKLVALEISEQGLKELMQKEVAKARAAQKSAIAPPSAPTSGRRR